MIVKTIKCYYFPSRALSTLSKKVHLKNNSQSINKLNRCTELSLNHFDGLYGKVYGKDWPSIRLGLLSPKKYCAILNSFVDNQEHHDRLVDEFGALDLQRYYKKHLHHYVRCKLRDELLSNKRARKRELMAKNEDVSLESINLESVEVSDISDSELKLAQTTDAEGGFSTAEDLQAMFSDRRMDDDEKYFINQANVNLSLEDFMPATELIFQEDVSDEMEYYDSYQDGLELDIEQRDEPTLEFNNHLKIYSFPRGRCSSFEAPVAVNQYGFLSYYLLDGASVLPVLALDLKMNDSCADYCAAPGGKSLAMLMSLLPSHIQANDRSRSRLDRMRRVVNQYAPEVSYVKSTLEFSNKNACSLVQTDAFDKILVDVPCSNDRHSINASDSIFKRSRTEERLNLPRVQSDILKAALKSVRPKGCVVYSTCTMSPIENDGVVQKALMQLQEENFGSKFAIMNLKEAFRPLRGLFKFKTNFKYGQQVVPNICSNFGPMYICKIKRIF